MKFAKSSSAKLIGRYRIDAPARFRLASIDCADHGGLDKEAAHLMLADDVKRLAGLQELLYAEGKWALLIVLQGMDAAGKDSVVAHVMSGVNPQGCEVHAFKRPSTEELDHNFLWRGARQLPPRGCIGIFNRSYYEEVLIVRVHPHLLQPQKIPQRLIGASIWRERFEDICAFERHLVRNGICVLKFFLHLSKEEQRRRFLDRLDEPAKRWKFSMDDVNERKRWGDYQVAYEEMIRATSTDAAPWYVVPADYKWFTRLVVASVIIETLQGLNLAVPKVGAAERKEMRQVREALEAEAPKRKRGN